MDNASEILKAGCWTWIIKDGYFCIIIAFVYVSFTNLVYNIYNTVYRSHAICLFKKIGTLQL